MNELKQRYLVAGSSALKPDCSRYSNENEHIIDFPVRTLTTYDWQTSRPSVKDYRSVSQRTRALVERSVMINDIRRGSLKGTPYSHSSKGSLALAGAVYTIIALAALFIAV